MEYKNLEDLNLYMENKFKIMADDCTCDCDHCSCDCDHCGCNSECTCDINCICQQVCTCNSQRVF